MWQANSQDQDQLRFIQSLKLYLHYLFREHNHKKNSGNTSQSTKQFDEGLHCLPFIQHFLDNPLYTHILHNDKICYNDGLTVTKPSLKR